MADPPTTYGSADASQDDEVLNGGSEGEGHQWWGAGGLCRRPRLLVDWKDGSRAAGERTSGQERHVSWAELFFDLVYVTAIARLGENLRGDGDELVAIPFVDYVAVFIAIYACWQHTTFFASRFFGDSLFDKAWLGCMQLGVVALAVHIRGGLASDNGTAFCYALASVYACLAFPQMLVHNVYPKYRVNSTVVLVGYLASAATALIGGLRGGPHRATWIFLSSSPIHFQQVYILLSRARITPWPFPRPPPVDLEHWIERHGLFMIIILGETVNGISVSVKRYPLAFYAAALAGFATVFCEKLLYFDVDVKELDDHGTRIDIRRGVAWTLLHYVLFCATAVVGSGVFMVCALEGGAGEGFDDPSAARLYIGMGYGVILVCLSAIRCLHAPATRRLPPALARWPRNLAIFCDCVQFVQGGALMSLPLLLDAEQLPDVSLVGIAAGAAVLNSALNVWARVELGNAEVAADKAADKAFDTGGPKAARRFSQLQHPVLDAVHVTMCPSPSAGESRPRSNSYGGEGGSRSRGGSGGGGAAAQALLPPVRGRRALTTAVHPALATTRVTFC